MDNIITAEDVLRLNALNSKTDKASNVSNEMEISEDVALIDTPSPLQTFTNSEFGSVRTIVQNNEPWFVAKDVCDCLEIKNSRQALARLDSDEKADVSFSDTSSNGVVQSRNFSTVNEYGLYSLILRSNKPEAKQFKKWITHEVIPSIRKYGGYVAGQENMTPEQFLSKALLYADSKMKDMQAKIEEMQPKAIFADAVSESKGSIQIASLAKLLCQNGIDIGRNRLFEWLRDNNYLCSHGDNRNLPTQSAMDLGLFRVKEVQYIDEFGIGRIGLTTMVTPKGQGYFINKFLCEKYS